jgi:uncharacterized membrane protein YgcG
MFFAFACLFVIRDGSFLPKLQASLISLSNTMGLVQVVLLLGYGLVELPRQTWKGHDLDGCLRRMRLSVVREYRARDDARTQLQMALDDVYRYQRIAEEDLNKERRLATKAALHELLNVDFLLWSDEDHRRAKNRATTKPNDFKWVPDEAAAKVAASKRSRLEPLPMAELVAFRAAVKEWKREHSTSEGRVELVERAAWSLEDVLAARAAENLVRANAARAKALPFSATAATTKLVSDDDGNDAEVGGGGNGGGSGGGGGGASIQWWDGSRSGAYGCWWHVTTRPARSKLLACLLAFLSLLIVAVTVDTLAAAGAGAGGGSGGGSNGKSTLFSDTSWVSPLAASLSVDLALGYTVGRHVKKKKN